MPDFGIGEAIAALSGADILGSLGSLFGIGDAAGAAAGAGAADVAGAAGAAGAGLGAAGAPLDILPAAAAFTPSAVGDILPATGALSAGLSLEPGLGAGISGLNAGGGGVGAGAGIPGAAGPQGALDNLAMGAAPGPAGAAPAPLPGAAGTPVDLTSLAADPNAGGAAGLGGGTTPGGATAAGAGPGGATPASGGSFMDKLGTGAINSITKNPLGTAAGVAGLGASVLGNKAPGGDATQQMKDMAFNLAQQQNAMRGYLESGTLPPGLQASVQQATDSAKARAVSNAAAAGQPTDPASNSSLMEQLNAIDQQATISQAQIAQSLLTTGLNEAGLSEQIYSQLVSIDQTQSQQVGKAISTFASALGGGGTKIQIGGTSSG